VVAGAAADGEEAVRDRDRRIDTAFALFGWLYMVAFWVWIGWLILTNGGAC
jgi:hypothetical protein